MPCIPIPDDSSQSSTSSSSSSSDFEHLFPRFNDLPPELRHEIWRLAAIPSPAINFFNVHCFPNDHAHCNRSSSPPWAYLDLRRLEIHHDDADVAQYDPSAWQARLSVRQSCREARLVCTIPDSKAATLVLTRPKRGLFVRAGDGRLRETPLFIQQNDEAIARASNSNSHSNSHNHNRNQTTTLPTPETLVRRTVRISTEDILVLSVENCSFNMPHEEAYILGDDFGDEDVDGLGLGSGGADGFDGWAFDPQLTPALPGSIPPDRLCAGMSRCSNYVLRFTTEALFSLLYSHIPGYLDTKHGELELWERKLLLMFDAHSQDIGERDLAELTPHPEVYWDRFGDCYARLPWKRGGQSDEPDGFPIMYRLTKIWPETNDLRERYLRSALLRSPKRPITY